VVRGALIRQAGKWQRVTDAARRCLSPELTESVAGFEGASLEPDSGTGVVCFKTCDKEVVMEHKIRHVLKHTLDELYELGRNIKKGQIQRQIQKLTNKRESHFIHTSTTKVRYERAMMKFADYLESRGIKREKHLDKLNTEELQKVVDDYFKMLAQDGLSQNTIKVHIAALQKSLAIIRPDVKKYLQDDERRISWWSAGKAPRKRDSYVNPGKIREKLDETHRMIAEAQALAGFRIREIAKAEVDRQNHRVIIHKAKGGRTRELDFSHRKEDFKRLAYLIEELKERHYEKHLKEYYKDLKKACSLTGQEYNASHAFRYEYAQRRSEELQKNIEELRDLLDKYGADEEKKEAAKNEETREHSVDYVLTRELGHNRERMSRYYYR